LTKRAVIRTDSAPLPEIARSTVEPEEHPSVASEKAAGSGRRLVIVESPAKAKTIRGYLGDGYDVEASVGHIRDLPTRAADIPAKYKKEKWARLGVDVANGFEPLYIVDADKKSKVSELKKKLTQADELLLATDEDREGEAIAWHLLQVLNPKVPVRRMVFHEITRDAIQAAVDAPRELDQRLVDAQETRRIIDRLYGYEVSPVLWRKVTQGLSAGRVQSVALRLVSDREVEIDGGRTVHDLLLELGVQPDTALVIRGGELVTRQDRLQNQDEVEIRPVISGGARP